MKNWHLLLSITILAIFCATSSQAQFVRPNSPYGNTVKQANITNLRGAIANSDATITLATASNNIQIWTDSASALMSLRFDGGGAATTSYPALMPAVVYTYHGPAISSFHYIGASASGNWNVVAY